MELTLKRVRQGKNSTLSELYVDGIFQCYGLEDRIQEVKVRGKTAIPCGTYALRLNVWGGMNTRYKQRFPDIHQGMIEIKDIPNFSNVYIHIGNTHEDTDGCLLVGQYFHQNKQRDDFEVYQSTEAYQELYKTIIEKVKDQHATLTIVHQFIHEKQTEHSALMKKESK